ncbi:LytTR family DNA-binding domain-containing protein [Streptococcus uberis]|uniref:LytTR family transcriptional regulator DNA-binding domain-containing protein n=1 Tax=Streptococcus uberis TaxID=1349 RepID=UPI001FF42931|nr:LytTR family DNA-binding domain-containing protein [Streptococcus uberis]MCK1228957.1 LytTR family DNA-binding domain-containing protein [Streptococcus uberis]
MKIYILDNEVKQQYKLEGLLEHIMFRKGWKFQKIECYSTPNQLLHALCQKGSHQLFLMDVALDGDNYKGIELAKYIRLIDPYANIVFFSNHMECIPLVLNHQLAALDFIPKDIQARELEKRIESVLNQVKNKVSFKMIENDFYYVNKRTHIQLPFKSLLYIETASKSHHLLLHTKYESIEFRASLSEVLKQESRLIKCHRSYLVNPENIVKVDLKEKMLHIKYGHTCFMSKPHLLTVMKSLEKINRN